MKLHALDHIPAHIYMYGVPKYHDTASFEHALIDDAVKAFNTTLKRKKTTSTELLTKVYDMLYCNILL